MVRSSYFMSKKFSNKQEFIQKAQKKHGNKYDYSKVCYVRSSSKVEIICHLHGIFSQTPASHISGCGCPNCGRIKIAQANRSSMIKFVETARRIHNNKYTYNDLYCSSKTKLIIVCPVHGEFLQMPDRHLVGDGCPSCAVEALSKRFRFTQEQFIQKAQQIHSNKYTYEKFVYVNAKTSGLITCPLHGDFLQKPREHLYKKAGCPKCKQEHLKGRYTEQFFEVHPQERNKMGWFYIVQLADKEGTPFVKIGITHQTLHYRLTQYGKYILLYKDQMPLYEAFTKEQTLLKMYDEYKYVPDNTFGGHTECFTIDVLSFWGEQK